MTNDSSNLISVVPTNRTLIQTVNGEYIGVTKDGTVDISSSMHLKNCLLIPSLSHKLLFVSQLSKELNCTNLISYADCFVLDAMTEKIIGRGTERVGLYFVDVSHLCS